MSYIGKNEAGEIPKLWDVCNHRFEKINTINNIWFGLCFSNPDGAIDDEFEYVAATEVKEDVEISEDMVLRNDDRLKPNSDESAFDIYVALK